MYLYQMTDCLLHLTLLHKKNSRHLLLPLHPLQYLLPRKHLQLYSRHLLSSLSVTNVAALIFLLFPHLFVIPPCSTGEPHTSAAQSGLRNEKLVSSSLGFLYLAHKKVDLGRNQILLKHNMTSKRPELYGNIRGEK